MNTVIICVRQGSSRLPGKALARLGDRSVLQHLVERYRACRAVDKIVVATTQSEHDDLIERVCKIIKVPCYRGSENDVVTRMDDALRVYAPGTKYIFRGLGDMLLFDKELLNWRYDILRERQADVIWTGYSDEPWPVYGSRESPWSRRAWDDIVERSSGSERIHAGQWLYTHLHDYRVLQVERLQDEYYHACRLELDTQADYELFQAVYKSLWSEPGTPSTLAALRWLTDNPEVSSLNCDIKEKTLTRVKRWGGGRGTKWICKSCGAAPMQTGAIRKGALETTCGRCGAVQDFVEVPGFLVKE